eukprot:CAMPEP_0202958246 /NCGR_PEP_ID=MMETSP1396-20130829/2612_1 /ASSEMBLY_ACC=CAM_ASM_000872 /TAXON_ID= /ORGANISM="Pseudokeronopsis sp., Strain Brazil" /LENGTH=165 /DNA_ID=CAMNT_0049676215 /DNA_START=215 /DNA_END=712 /DNA_ORIENTATION=+
MDRMIDHNLLQIGSVLLKHKEWEVREQAATLVGNFATSKRARELFHLAFPKLKELLEDPVLEVREQIAMAFMKLSTTDDGCQRIVASSCAETMIHSFIRHSKDSSCLKREDGLYLIYLLEAFTNLTFNDYSIEPLLGKGAIVNFCNITSQKYVEEIMRENHCQKI